MGTVPKVTKMTAPVSADQSPAPSTCPVPDGDPSSSPNERKAPELKGTSSSTPRAPFRPRRFSVRRPKAGTTRTRDGREVRCWDVVFSVDGQRGFRRFTAEKEKANDANLYVQSLQHGWADPRAKFDPVSKMFYRPEDLPGADKGHVSVATWTMDFWTSRVPAWAPATRKRQATMMYRVAVSLLRPGAPDMPAHIDRQIYRAFTVTAAAYPSAAADWLSEWSMPLRDVKAVHLQNMLESYRKKLDGTQISPKSEKRFVDAVAPMWERALALEVVDRNPWKGVQRLRISRTRGGVHRDDDIRPVNVDIVLSQTQVAELADHCAALRPGFGVYRALIHMMGNGGVRPGEALGLRVGDVAFFTGPDGSEFARVKVTRTAMSVSKSWLTPDDDPNFGPLKGLGSDDFRITMLAPASAKVMRRHLREHRAFAGPDEPLFLNHHGRTIWWQNFGRDVWDKARRDLYAGTALENLNRHDLRHAACSAWLNADVPLSTACGWSGHATLSVFLNVYQGVMQGDEDLSLSRLLSYENRDTA